MSVLDHFVGLALKGLTTFSRHTYVNIHMTPRTSLMYDALHDLVAFVQFKEREKHPWRSVNFSKVAG